MNKNTKARMALARKNAKHGQPETQFEIPVTMKGGIRGSYTRPVRIGFADKEKGIVSVNAQRNMCQLVALNTDANGKSVSFTRHEAWNRGQPTYPYKHKIYDMEAGLRKTVVDKKQEAE